MNINRDFSECFHFTKSEFCLLLMHIFISFQRDIKMVPILGVPMIFLGVLLYKLGFISYGIFLILGGVPMSVGFGPFGILLGSLASSVQSVIGNVMTGSLFATTQSFTALLWGRFPGLTLALIFIFGLWNGYI